MNHHPDAGFPQDPVEQYPAGQYPAEQSPAEHDPPAWHTPSTEVRFPWPPADGESIITAYARTWQESALRPSQFFAALPTSLSLRATLLYYMPIGIAVAGAALFWSTIRGAVPAQDSVLGAAGGAGWSPLIEFLLTPVLLLISLFVSAAFTHVLLKLLGGAGRGYSHTVRIFGFAYSPQILGVIPVIGQAVGFIWMVGVAIIGVREGHRTGTGRAAAAVLIPVMLALFMMAVFMLIARSSGLLTEFDLASSVDFGRAP